MMLNVPNPKPTKVNGEDLPTIEEFAFLGSTVRQHGVAGSNIKNCFNFRMVNNVWKSSQYSTKTKLRLHQLLHICLRMLEDDQKRTQQTAHLPHQESKKNSTCVRVRDHLQPTSPHPLQPKMHGHYCRAKALEMDRTRDEKRAGQHLTHSSPLDTRGIAEVRAKWRKGSSKPFITPGERFRS